MARVENSAREISFFFHFFLRYSFFDLFPTNFSSLTFFHSVSFEASGRLYNGSYTNYFLALPPSLSLIRIRLVITLKVRRLQHPGLCKIIRLTENLPTCLNLSCQYSFILILLQHIFSYTDLYNVVKMNLNKILGNK